MQNQNSRGGLAGIMAIGTAVTASACCIGPAILLAMGVGGLGFAAFLEPYRPYFLALTALFLGGAFYVAYRPLEAEACTTDGHCAPTSRRRMRTGVWIAAVIALGAAAYPRIESARAKAPVPVTGVRTAMLEIRGMTCEACANRVRGELEKVPGVNGAVVEYPEGRAIVELGDPGVTDIQLLAAVERTGYTASIPVGDDPSTAILPAGGCCSLPPSVATNADDAGK